MSIKEDLEKIEKKANNIETESFAKTFLEEFKKTNQRLFVIVLILLAYAGFITYLYLNTGTETITETVDTEGNGNACIGDNCYNGDING